MYQEYRKYITIDAKRTCEYDYSQLNPHMVYFLKGKKMGDEDAYDRVFDGEHRDIVKRGVQRHDTGINRPYSKS